MAQVLPTGQLNKTSKRQDRHKTFEVEPHSARQARVSADYHGRVISQMNPSKRRDNARRYPQTGLGG